MSVATDKVTKTVKDTVVYENLLAGETYKLTGQLMKITADKEEEVATKETTFVADASGNGTTSLEFEDVSLEAGVKYVVYETAESEKEIDFKEGKEKHKVEHKDKDDKAQTVVVTKEKPTKPSGKLATTVEVDGTKADAQKELELSVATDKVTKTVKDTVVYENLLAGETYKLTGQLMKITADKEEEVATKETTFVADASGNGTTSLEFEDVSLEAGVKYVVYETAESEKEIDFKEGKEKHKVEHKDKDDKAQTVVVTKEKPTKPSGKLATTVEVDGTKADAQKELELSVATDKVTKTVKDTVVYENLLAGETYKLTGQLMKITADKEEEVATKETTFVADASGNGTTSLEFEDVSLEAGVKYVVYETAESEKEIDFKEGKEKHKVEHKDKDDKAQTVVVTKEKPTKPSGKLATTVEVDGTKADAQKELELSVATDKVTKTVKDTVVYENLLAGETYKLTGQLMKITADKEEEVATKETTFVADASGNGTTSLEFEDVSLEAGVKYVVYETAESEKEIDFKEGKEKHKVEHKDKDDKAQTVVVTKEKPTKPSGKLATTVEVDGTKADAQKELELSVATDKVTKTVKDTVVYENLLAGETYKLTGQLMKITADKEEEVATKETTFVADASGNGTTSLEFEDVSLEAGVKYVVYETAESEKEIDFKEGKEKHKVEHKDKDDKAQTVVVTKEKPTKPSGKLATTVEVDGTKADAQKELELSVATDKVTKTVKDTVVYENLLAGETYKLTGQLMKITADKEEEVATKETTFVADASGNGTTSLEFEDVSLEAGVKYVVYETAESEKEIDFKEGKEKHKVEHKDKDDKAQTVVVTYLAVTDIHFSVDETGQVTVTNVNGNTAVAEGNKLTVTDQTKPVTPPSPEEPGAQEVHFSKVNVGGEEIAGAEIHIKQDDTVVASWVSEAGKTHTLKLKPGHYIFHEAVAPGGYLAVTDIHFSVDETGQVTVTNVNGNTAVAEGNKLTVTDQTKPVTPPSPEEPGAQEVHFSKVNVGGEEIAGAEIHIKQDDTVVASWVSEAGKTHTLKLKPGHYIFHEAVAPGGYLAVTDIHFSVDETGQVTVTNVNGNTAVAEGNKLTVTDQSADKDKQDKLPNTGETTGTYLSILGMITAVFASLLYRSKKK
ncbi:collagen-binding protein A [Streptococcus pneumoniae]|nr:collagen-binding protein A [Streptococcus pneumoniae]